MRRQITVMAIVAAAVTSPALATSFDSGAAGKCFVYGVQLNKSDITSSVKRLAGAYRSGDQVAAQGQIFMERIIRLKKSGGAAEQVLVSEGRAGCKTIGVM